MRYLTAILLITSLAACQTSTPSKNTSVTTDLNATEPTPPTTGKHVEEIDPLEVATELTYNLEIAHALASGTFTQFDSKTLEELKATFSKVDHPGMSLLYLKFLREMQDFKAKERINSKYESLKKKPGMSHQHMAFVTKVHGRIVSITLEEEEMASLCMTEYTWNYLPDNQRSTFDKMAIGIAISPKEIQDLKVTATGRSNEIMPVKCVLEPMELYGRFKKLFLY